MDLANHLLQQWLVLNYKVRVSKLGGKSGTILYKMSLIDIYMLMCVVEFHYLFFFSL